MGSRRTGQWRPRPGPKLVGMERGLSVIVGRAALVVGVAVWSAGCPAPDDGRFTFSASFGEGTGSEDGDGDQTEGTTGTTGTTGDDASTEEDASDDTTESSADGETGDTTESSTEDTSESGTEGTDTELDTDTDTSTEDGSDGTDETDDTGTGGGEGYLWNGAYWYLADDFGQTCNDVCIAHGGSQLGAQMHQGTPVSDVLSPEYLVGGDTWQSFECLASNDLRWGSTGSAPTGDESHGQCRYYCPCAG